MDPACRGVQHGRGRHAAGERVQQELDRVRPLVVAEQDGRLAVGEDEGLLAGVVLAAGAVEPRITSYNVCYTKLLRLELRELQEFPSKLLNGPLDAAHPTRTQA